MSWELTGRHNRKGVQAAPSQAAYARVRQRGTWRHCRGRPDEELGAHGPGAAERACTAGSGACPQLQPGARAATHRVGPPATEPATRGRDRPAPRARAR
eukprot:13525652-Alexandrium_andersonii.AAC.1